MRCVILFTLLLATPQTPQPPRDAGTPTTGSASISGIVVSDDDAKRPIRRARVSVLSPAVPGGVLPSAMTDDRGAFTLKDLPGGVYNMTVSKEAHPSFSYGATRPGRQGTPISLTDGQQLTGVVVRFPRAAAITGTVVDQDGKPLAGASVQALRYSFVNGERRLGPAGSSAHGSDDRGIYRIFSLSAGQYILRATVSQTTLGARFSDLVQTTAADVAFARQQLATPATAQSSPGLLSADTRAAAPPRARSVGYASIFYPGTPVASQATMLTLAAGEERSGVDFTLHLVSSGRIDGTVSAPDGVTPDGILVTLVAMDEETAPSPFESIRTMRTGKDGTFNFGGVRSGRYVVTARAASRGARNIPASVGLPIGDLWAMTEVTTDGNDATVTLDLQEGMTISGRLQFEASELQPPPDLSRFRVTLMPAQGAGEVSLGAPAGVVDASGTFTISGVAPGRYRISSGFPTGVASANRWTLKSSIVGGRDTLDTPIEIRPHQHVADVVVTFTDRPAEISGVLQDAQGNPTSGYYILVFAADATMWTPQSRRIQAVRPAQDGKYTTRSLAAGDYVIVALSDVENGEWFDPTFLQRIAPSGIRVTVADGEKKLQDLRVSRQ